MKNSLITLAFALVSSLVLAQTTTENYVKSTTYKAPVQNQTEINALTDDDKIESITYLDGLGRPKQSIAKQAGGNHEDIITPAVYDNLGRQLKNYLPYYRANSSFNYETSLIPDINDNIIPIHTQYLSRNPDDFIGMPVLDANPYSESHFEASPLNRVLEQGAPGADWKVDQASDTDHTIKFEYLTNGIDEVELFKVIFPTLDTEQPQLYYQGFYGANELYKTVTKDENWQSNPNCSKAHTTEEFKNSSGQVILKRTYTIDDNNDCVPHDTYYTYDDFGNLTYVLSPKGSDLVLSSKYYKAFSTVANHTSIVPTDRHGQPITSGSGTINASIDPTLNTITVVFDVSFNTAIDLKNGAVIQLNQNTPNMIIGTILNGNYTISVQDGYLYIAGSGNTNLVDETIVADLPTSAIDEDYINDLCYQYHYDKRNRLVEKKIPQKGWEYIVYDNLDRPILTQDALQSSPLYKEWLFTKYDQFDRVAYTGSLNTNISRLSLQSQINSETQYSVVQSSNASTIDGESVYYSNDVYPFSSLTLHTVNYYDSYNATLTSAFSNPGTSLSQDVTNDTKSLPTGSLVRVLDTNDWITSVSYYDDKAQPIYMGSENDYLSTTDIIKTELNFIGSVLKTETSHTKGTGNNAIVVTDRFTYDHANRLLTQKQQITGEAEELIVKNEYDELGQLVSKAVGNEEASPLQSVDYTYNIRGWLQQINDPNTIGIGNDLFSFKINYNTTDLGMGNDALFNGNISETIWKTANDITNNTTRGYAYDYDALNRIISGNMAENTGSGYTQANGYHLNGLQYDKNGNIKSLKRTGATSVFDDLIYKYDGNQLVYVTDLITNQQTEGFIDGHTSGTDYVYDDNGNMIEDKNKKITSISYNHLNLPTEVIFNSSNTEKINYIYDATGLKLKKVVNNKGNLTTTEYAGNYIYEDSALKFFSHPEGYVEPNGASYEYVYQYKDHLGNIRLSFSDPNDSYQDILDSDLTNSYDGWVHNSNATSEFVNGSLKVNVDGQYEGVRNLLSNVVVTAGEVVDVSVVFDKDTTQSNVRLYFQELDANGNHLSWNIIDSNLQTGTHNYAYTVTSGSKLSLRIDKDNTNTSSLTSFYIDHVSVTTGALEIVEENNYYPFGLKHKGYNYVVNSTNIAQNYKYNGKELNEELGLNWYDYGARNYDASLGRWMNIDPLAEKYYDFSPYIYAMNSPMNYIDPDGRFTVRVTGDDADTAVNELDEDSALSLSRDAESGTVSINDIDQVDYESLNNKDKRLYDAIQDESKTVNLSTSRDVMMDGGVLLIGRHMGQDLTDANQIVNVEQSLSLENNGGQSAGTSIFHEIDEAYSAMEIVNATDILEDVFMAFSGVRVPKQDPTRNVYDAAHARASDNDPNFSMGNIRNNQIFHQNDTVPPTLWLNLNPAANAATPGDPGWFRLNNNN